MDLDSPYHAKKMLEKWMDGQEIDFENRTPQEDIEFSYSEKPFDPNVEIEMVQGIDPNTIQELYSQFDT
ncbi:hypothetical protein ACQRBP_16140 [Eubacteriales bacterium SGI.150]